MSDGDINSAGWYRNEFLERLSKDQNPFFMNYNTSSVAFDMFTLSDTIVSSRSVIFSSYDQGFFISNIQSKSRLKRKQLRGISSNISNLDWWDYKIPTDKEYKELINRLKQKVYKQRPGVYRIV